MTLDATRIGTVLREAREAKGLSQEALALELRLPQPLLQAIEEGDWERVPPGRERPLTRLVALHLDLDLAHHAEAFAAIPGGPSQEEPHPRQEHLERILTGTITLGCLALLLWLVVPGRSLKERMPTKTADPTPIATAATSLPKAYTGAYPVLGEVLPDVPINEEGILVNLRSVDICEVQIQGPGTDLKHLMQVSEPWRLRVKGPFTLSLNNAGVANLLVAGRQIQPDRAVGESWTGRFGEDGRLILPEKTPAAFTPEPDDAETEPSLPESQP